MKRQPSEPVSDELLVAADALPRSRRRRWRWLPLRLFGLYVFWCVSACSLQTRIMFPRHVCPEPMPGERYNTATTVFKIQPKGVDGSVVAWFVPAPRASADHPAPAVVYFHGNAELIDYQSDRLETYRQMGVSVLLPEYRGYGRSAGSPSEAGIVEDAVAFYDLMVKRSDVDASRIVIHGRSLGGGPAAALAARRPATALILESTFSSAAAMSKKYLVPQFLVQNPFRTDNVLRKFDEPVLIFHGAHDDIIPVWHGQRLAELARHGTYVEYDCEHNDFPGDGNDEDYWVRIRKFLGDSGILKDGAS